MFIFFDQEVTVTTFAHSLMTGDTNMVSLTSGGLSSDGLFDEHHCNSKKVNEIMF